MTINCKYRSDLATPAILRPKIHRRVSTRDVAFNYRMGAGFAGQVTRTHPVNLEPRPLHATTPPVFYGSAVILDASTGTVRIPAAGDSGTTLIYGIAVRPYPFQASAGDSAYGGAAFATSATPAPIQAGQVVDILRSGYVMVPLCTTYGSPTSGGEAFVYCNTNSGAHLQGGFEGATGANTMALSGYPGTVTYMGPVDATTGLVELAFNI
jgi:hypothetical protein